MKDPRVTRARARARIREHGWLFNGRYSAIGGSDREIAFPADEALAARTIHCCQSPSLRRRSKGSAYGTFAKSGIAMTARTANRCQVTHRRDTFGSSSITEAVMREDHIGICLFYSTTIT